MLFGFIIGILYARYGFNGKGNKPKIACSLGPVQDGTLILCGHHIHHWMVAAPCCILSIFASFFVPSFLGCYDFAAFCFVMTVHGLCFSDRCDTKVEVSSETSETSETSESSTETSELEA